MPVLYSIILFSKGGVILDKKDISYVLHKTSSMELRDKEDFLALMNKVFDLELDFSWYSWKYDKNIFGPSYIACAYDGDRLIGIRSFWRHDIYGIKGYQPCDTAVDKDYRGYGIYTVLTKLCLEKLDSYLIFNYPNENSRHGAYKLGWKLKNYFYLKKTLASNTLERDTIFLEDDYLTWKFKSRPDKKYYYTVRNGNYYLLSNRRKNIYYALARFSKNQAELFEEAKMPILFHYGKEESLIYKFTKNRAHLVSFDNGKSKDLDIGIHTADFF